MMTAWSIGSEVRSQRAGWRKVGWLANYRSWFEALAYCIGAVSPEGIDFDGDIIRDWNSRDPQVVAGLVDHRRFGQSRIVGRIIVRVLHRRKGLGRIHFHDQRVFRQWQ